MDEDLLGLSFNPWALALGLIFSIIGWWVFKECRRRNNLRGVLLGLALMIAPYFIDGALLNLAVGVGLCVGVYAVWE